MGFKAVEAVIQHSGHKGAAFTVELVLAFRANDETGRCHPSLRTLALESRLSQSGVLKAIGELAVSGEVVVEKPPMGEKRGVGWGEARRAGPGKGKHQTYTLRVGYLKAARGAALEAGQNLHVVESKPARGGAENLHVVESKPAPRAGEHTRTDSYEQTTTGAGGGDDVAVVALLVAAGVTKGTAEDLARTHPHELIRRQLEWLPHRNVKTSPEGMLVKAIQGNWPSPRTWAAEDERRHRPESTAPPAIAVEPPRELTPDEREQQRNFWALQLRRRGNGPLSEALYASVHPWFSTEELAGYGFDLPPDQAEARGA